METGIKPQKITKTLESLNYTCTYFFACKHFVMKRGQESDEVSHIVEGKMKLEFRDRIVHLSAGEMCVVPKGVEHRPICDSAVTAMLIEVDGTLTLDNIGGTYKG